MKARVLVLVCLVVVATGSTASVADAVVPQCWGKAATIVGTVADETIRGSAGADVIVGGGGDDEVYGLGGADRICINLGEAVERSGSRIFGGGGADRLRGNAQRFSGGAGADTLFHPRSCDGCFTPTLIGGTGDDVLRLRGGGWFRPGRGDDTVVGARGNPFSWVKFRGARRGVVVNLRAGTAVGQGRDVLKRIHVVTGSEHADVVVGTSTGVNAMFGRNGQDVFVGRGGFDFAVGGDGADSLNGGPGGDQLVGGNGNDWLFGRGGNDLLLEKRPGANLILAGGGKDNCYGSYRIPPSVERGCETHRKPPTGDRTALLGR